jgi:hypothetical protein
VELLPERHRDLLGTVILFADSSTMLLVPLYHRFLSKNWLYFHLVSLALNALAVVFMFMIPESPKYLIGKGRYDRAKASLKVMARINGKLSHQAEIERMDLRQSEIG